MDNTTARIDMQRLAILNDRLCQTIDALNQVRMTAHGFAPTMGTNHIPYYGAGIGFGSQFSNGFVPHIGWNGAPFYGTTPVIGANSHFGLNPYATSPSYFGYGIGGLNYGYNNFGLNTVAPLNPWNVGAPGVVNRPFVGSEIDRNRTAFATQAPLW